MVKDRTRNVQTGPLTELPPEAIAEMDAAAAKASANGSGDDKPIVKAPPKTPRQRWESVGEKRILRCCKVMRQAARCFNAKQYAATDDERALALELLEGAWKEILTAAKGQTAPLLTDNPFAMLRARNSSVGQ